MLPRHGLTTDIRWHLAKYLHQVALWSKGFTAKPTLTFVVLNVMISLFGLIFEARAGLEDLKAIESLPVLDGGRVKPYGVWAKEVLQLIYGKQSYEGRPAYEVVTTMWLEPQLWQEKEIFQIKRFEIKKALGLSDEVEHLSWKALNENPRLPDLMQMLQDKRANKEKLDPFFQDVARLESALVTFREMASGRLLRVLPVSFDQWKDLTELNEEELQRFMRITQAFVENLGDNKDSEARLQQAIKDFLKLYPSSVPVPHRSIAWELWYEKWHPFRWAYGFYFLTAVALLVGWIMQKPWPRSWAYALASLGVIMHIMGFTIRSYLTGRAPVTNMYETVVWVSFGAFVFSVILEIWYKSRLYLGLGALGAALALLLSDMSPAVLDPSLQPLEPVLRSNFWLTVHVLTITVSYAAFLLAFILGNVGLFYWVRSPEKKELIESLTLGCYRAVQMGVALLAPGIILGGVWADYSWGRFWGWDPKETWALIALLGYLALLHARLIGWLKSFGFMAWSVLSFHLVIMAWYGVNYVLGAGLHSYGFGAGGLEYVSAFVVLNMAYVFFTWLIYRGLRSKEAR